MDEVVEEESSCEDHQTSLQRPCAFHCEDHEDEEVSVHQEERIVETALVALSALGVLIN